MIFKHKVTTNYAMSNAIEAFLTIFRELFN